MIWSNKKMLLVDSRRGGMNCECYDDHLQMVLAVMNSGHIGDGTYGSDAHAQALDLIEAHLKEVREQIVKDNTEPEYEEN